MCVKRWWFLRTLLSMAVTHEATNQRLLALAVAVVSRHDSLVR